MQHKVVPIIHNNFLAAKKSAHLSYMFHENSPESSFHRTSKRCQSAYLQKNSSPRTSITTTTHEYEKYPSIIDREIQHSGPITFQICDPSQFNKEPNSFASSIQTEKQLRDMCGLQSFDILNLLENFHRDIEDIPNIKTRIVLTFIKLKTNISFTFLSTIFVCDECTTQKIFNQTVKNLTKVFEDIDFDFPKKVVDENFQHFKFALECLELQADSENFKVFLKITPSGIVKYLGKSFSHRLPSGFQLTGLEDFESGDCIWLGKGVIIDDDNLKRKGVRFVTRKNPVTSIQRVLSKIKSLKILEGRMSLGLLPHLKNIMNTICGVCNLSDRC